MPVITFNRLHFFRTLIIFALLTLIWLFFTIKVVECSKMAISIGHLTILPVSIYFGQPLKKIGYLAVMIAVSISAFLFSNFFLNYLVISLYNSTILYAIINSLFAAAVMSLLIHKIYKIQFLYQTIGATTILLLIGYYLIFGTAEYLFENGNSKNLNTLFCVFQLLLIVPLAAGIALRLKQED